MEIYIPKGTIVLRDIGSSTEFETVELAADVSVEAERNPADGCWVYRCGQHTYYCATQIAEVNLAASQERWVEHLTGEHLAGLDDLDEPGQSSWLRHTTGLVHMRSGGF